MADAYIDLVPDTGQILKSDLRATIERTLHEGAQELIDLEVPLIRARTPVLTGALRDDVTGIPYAVGEDIAFLYTEDTNQLATWGRIYAPYQEGPPLGFSTWTNAPHQMFNAVLTDDIPVIEQWGIEACQHALDLCAAGNGVPYKNFGP